jgi:hypothetical protein
MQRQKVHLLRRLDAHKAHGPPLHRLCDGFRVAVVVLVPFEERSLLSDVSLRARLFAWQQKPSGNWDQRSH